MTSRSNKLIQIIALMVHVLNIASDAVSPKAKSYIVLVVSLLQAASGVLAHYSNPDGTPAEAAWIPEERKSEHV